MTKTVEWCITYPVGDGLHGRVYVNADSKVSIDDLLELVTPDHIDNTDLYESGELSPDVFQDCWRRKGIIQVFDEVIDQDVTFYLEPEGWICDIPEPVDGVQTHFVK